MTQDIVERLRISRTYVRGPGDIGYDYCGFVDKFEGKPIGAVEDERKEAADEITKLRAERDRLETDRDQWRTLYTSLKSRTDFRESQS